MNTACTAINFDEDYPGFQRSISENFERLVTGKLFTTDAADLFALYLDGFPEGRRQHYNCHACKKFVETYGGLVEISSDGRATPVFWDTANTPDFFAASVSKLFRAVSKAKVTGVFFDKQNTWGTPITGEWRHLHVNPVMDNVFYSRLQTPLQAGAEKKEDFKNVIRALIEFPLEAVAQAVNIVNHDILYRSEKILGQAIWLKSLHEAINANKAFKANIVWAAIASAPSGFCHPRSSMIGSLLEDIVAGLPFNAIKDKFDKKMHPLQYQRPQAAPSAGNIADAEKVIGQLGVARSLERRFATVEEVEKIWAPSAQQEQKAGGIFGHLRPKGSEKAVNIEMPAKVMTWEKFYKEVLPTAEKIEFVIPWGNANYAAILTAQHDDAPPILQWDREHQRNPFSWYLYNGGSSPQFWSLPSNGPAEVTAVCYQPSMWRDANNTHQGCGVMFVIQGAKDSRARGVGNGLFPEILKSDLRGIRATLEAYSRTAELGGIEQASACGLMLQKGGQWDAEFKVTSNGIANKYKLDRWD